MWTFQRKFWLPEKSGLPQYSNHPQKHEPEEMNSTATAGAFHKHSFRKEEWTQGCGLWDLCILLWGVIYLLFHLLNCQSVKPSCDSLLLEQLLLVELGSHASSSLLCHSHPGSLSPFICLVELGVHVYGGSLISLIIIIPFHPASLLTLEPQGPLLLFPDSDSQGTNSKLGVGMHECIAPTFIVTMY